MPNQDEQTGRSAAWGVAAALFGAGAFATWPVAVAPKSTFPIWPTYVFAGVAALALYMCFATIWDWWPTGQSARGSRDVSAEPSAADSSPGTAEAETQASSMTADDSASVAPASLPPPPVSVMLMPELDTATNYFRLGALNRGELGRFRVEVISSCTDDTGRRTDCSCCAGITRCVGPRTGPREALQVVTMRS